MLFVVCLSLFFLMLLFNRSNKSIGNDSAFFPECFLWPINVNNIIMIWNFHLLILLHFSHASNVASNRRWVMIARRWAWNISCYGVNKDAKTDMYFSSVFDGLTCHHVAFCRLRSSSEQQQTARNEWKSYSFCFICLDDVSLDNKMTQKDVLWFYIFKLQVNYSFFAFYIFLCGRLIAVLVHVIFFAFLLCVMPEELSKSSWVN